MMLFHKMLKEKGLDVGPGKDVMFDVVAPAQIPEVMSWDENGDIGGLLLQNLTVLKLLQTDTEMNLNCQKISGRIIRAVFLLSRMRLYRNIRRQFRNYATVC